MNLLSQPGRALFRLLADRRPFYVVSHERSGTHFAINTIFRNAYVEPRFRYVGDWLGPYNLPQTRYRHLEEFRKDWPEWATGGGIVKTHADAELFRRWYPAAPVVYVVRDPRDTMVSFFHYLNSDELYRTNPGLVTQRCGKFSDFLRRPLSDYLKYGFAEHPDFENVVARWASHVSGWINIPNVCVVRFEELQRDFRAVVRRVCRAAGLMPRFRQQAVGLHDAAATLPRRGQSGEWKSCFSGEDENFLREQLGLRGMEHWVDEKTF